MISKGDFFLLCQSARRASLTEKNIKAAFAVTGIYPFRQAQVLNLVEKAQSMILGPAAHISGTIHLPSSSTTRTSEFHTHELHVPTNTQEVIDLRRQIEVSEDVVALKAGGIAMAAAAETAIAKSLIADKNIRQIASAPKKSKSDRHHISKALLISRSHLDKVKKKRIEKDSITKARKELHEQRKIQNGKQSPAKGAVGSCVMKIVSQLDQENGGSSVTEAIPTHPYSPPTTEPPHLPPLGAMNLLPLHPISGNYG